MILARIPRRRPASSGSAPVAALSADRDAAPARGEARPVSPLGPATVLALGGVLISAVGRMRARGRRRAEAEARRAGRAA